MADRVASARVDEDVHKALERYAKATTRNKAQVVEMAIRAFLATPEVAAILKAR
jgi:predicted transcriptional regulator